MFLNILSAQEKLYFVELAYQAMKVNGEIQEREQSIYNAFLVETGLSEYKLQNKPLSEVVTYFAGSTKKVQKAVLVELLSILVSDRNLDRDEKGFLDKAATEWNIRETEVRRMTRWVEDFNELLAEGFAYIMQER